MICDLRSFGSVAIDTEHLLLGVMRRRNGAAGEILEIVRTAGTHPDTSGLTFCADVSSQVDEIKALVQQLARLPSGGNEARALTAAFSRRSTG
jgi:hypothetical protein